ncbi:MAG: hypothetical protein WC607_01000 [Candidatus Micrarchaeia archaeon]
MIFLFFLENILQWVTYFWWVWLFFLAWYYYNWAREHLAFSPLLTLAVGGILVYYLVIEHPFVGSFGMIFWIVFTSGILYMLPTVSQLYKTFIPSGPPKPPGGSW